MASLPMCNHCAKIGNSPTDKVPEFCIDCRTKEQRGEMCKANKENNPKYQCKTCGINNEG